MKFLKNKNVFKNQDFFILLPNLLDIVECKPNLNVCLDDILFVEEQKKVIFQMIWIKLLQEASLLMLQLKKISLRNLMRKQILIKN